MGTQKAARLRRRTYWTSTSAWWRAVHALAMLACALAMLVWGSPARAHAALLASDPPSAAVLADAPSHITLNFNEPVSPLVFKLLNPNGEAVPLGVVRQMDDAVEVALPALPVVGGYVFSWRVVSPDGHPVGGALAFSVGKPGAAPALAPATNPARSLAIWGARLILYVGLLFGVGAVVFRAFMTLADTRQRAGAPILAGGIAVLASLGLSGLDALDAPLLHWHQLVVWETALSTSAGLAAFLALLALAFAWGSRVVRGWQCRFWALLALVVLGLSFAATGHASAAPPYWISRPSVWLHGMAATLWVGSLVPLARSLRSDNLPDHVALQRFSTSIPFVLCVLLASGGLLVWLQLDRPSSLWETAYGQVLLAKLGLVAMLLGLGAFNRYRLTQAVLRGESCARARMRRVVLVEVAVAVAILGAVAVWRFTPPPRALAAAAVADEIAMHMDGVGVTGHLVVKAPRAGQLGHVRLFLFDAAMAPINASEVRLWFSNKPAGIEPIQYDAVPGGDGSWEVSRLSLPELPRWSLRVDALVSDFERLSLAGDLVLGR